MSLVTTDSERRGTGGPGTGRAGPRGRGRERRRLQGVGRPASPNPRPASPSPTRSRTSLHPPSPPREPNGRAARPSRWSRTPRGRPSTRVQGQEQGRVVAPCPAPRPGAAGGDPASPRAPTRRRSPRASTGRHSPDQHDGPHQAWSAKAVPGRAPGHHTDGRGEHRGQRTGLGHRRRARSEDLTGTGSPRGTTAPGRERVAPPVVRQSRRRWRRSRSQEQEPGHGGEGEAHRHERPAGHGGGEAQVQHEAAPRRGDGGAHQREVGGPPEVEGKQPGEEVARVGSARPRRRRSARVRRSSQIQTAHTRPNSDCTTQT